MFSYKPVTIKISFRIVGIIFILSTSCLCFLTNQLLLTFSQNRRYYFYFQFNHEFRHVYAFLQSSYSVFNWTIL